MNSHISNKTVTKINHRSESSTIYLLQPYLNALEKLAFWIFHHEVLQISMVIFVIVQGERKSAIAYLIRASKDKVFKLLVFLTWHISVIECEIIQDKLRPITTFDSVVIRIDFKWIDSVKLILDKSVYNVKWFMFGFMYVKPI